MRLRGGAVVILLMGMGLVGIAPAKPAAPAVPAACGSASLLAAHLDNQTGHVQLSPNTCYWITDRFWLHGTKNLTIDANGDHFYQVLPSTDTGLHPLVYLTQNTNLEINNINVTGLYDGTNGGPRREGSYGILAEANHGLTVRGSSVQNVQGDFINLQSPNGLPTSDLNTGVMVTNDTFTNAGYHGITIEAVDGATFSHDHFDGMGPDAIDLEADIYSSNIAVGEGRYRAENNIDIRNNYFSGFTSDWFANIQPQVPGVQEQNVKLSNNTIDAGTPLAEVIGPPLGATTKPYFLDGLSITGNKDIQPASSTHGGSITVPFVGSAMTIQNAVSVSITGNTFPLFDGICPPAGNYFCNTHYLAVVQANDIYGLTISGNQFPGALGVLHPDSSGNAAVSVAGNN